MCNYRSIVEMATVVNAVATVVQVGALYFYWQQLAASNKQIEIAKSQFKDTQNQTLSLANRQLRAYIGASYVKSNSNVWLKENMISQIEIKNTGMTPARRIVYTTDSSFYPLPFDSIIPPKFIVDTKLDLSQPLADLGQNQPVSISVRYEGKVTKNDISDIEKVPYIIFGRIKYEDLDENTHYSIFCFMFHSDDPASYELCPKFNTSN